jgi:anionic cell wall polymer biosynthesis LytR-Cps2A-Psr (LCP) family protein
MMNVGNYSYDGEYLGDSYLQVAYAHMGGDGGGTLSCENTANAVSDFLGGQKIDGYIALKMEAIPMLNNLVGGVTVTIEDDFSESDPSLVIGETVKLTDDQAWHYVHDRRNVGDGSNECRMRRQDTYIAGLKEILQERMQEDEDFALDVYHALMDSDYLTTNMTDKEFGRIVNSLLEYESAGQIEITGTLDTDRDDYVTFTADEQSVQDAITTLFYRKEE